uniref:Uncharacterized protein n=1 Tax=Corvus moneduloides TaxID=1196302 RepID=A0A8C3GT58_CORMO
RASGVVPAAAAGGFAAAALGGKPGTKTVFVKLRYQRSALRAKVCGCTVYLGRCSFPYSRSFSSTVAAACTRCLKRCRRRDLAALLLAVTDATTAGAAGAGSGGALRVTCLEGADRPCGAALRDFCACAIAVARRLQRGNYRSQDAQREAARKCRAWRQEPRPAPVGARSCGGCVAVGATEPIGVEKTPEIIESSL